MTDDVGSRPLSGFLSAEWFEALKSRVASAAARRLAADGPFEPLRLAVALSGVPWADDGEFAYTIVLAGSADVIVGTAVGADVVLVSPYGAARSLAEGGRRAGDLLEAGAIRVRGDVARLLASAELLSLLAPSSTLAPPAESADRYRH